MQRINQKGFSVVEALIILVVLGLLAFAGLFVWGRQRTNDTNLTQTGPSQAPKPSSNMQDKSKILVGKLDGSFGVDFSFKYPDSWKLESNIEGPVPLSASHSTVETITVTSPSGKYVVRYKVGANGGLGGACDPTTGAKLLSMDVTAVPGYPAAKYVEASQDKQPSVPPMPGEENKIVYRMALMNTADIDGATVGGNDCQLYLADVLKLKPVNDITILDASVRASVITEDSAPSDFKNMRAAPEYITAKAILVSTTVK